MLKFAVTGISPGDGPVAVLEGAGRAALGQRGEAVPAVALEWALKDVHLAIVAAGETSRPRTGMPSGVSLLAKLATSGFAAA